MTFDKHNMKLHDYSPILADSMYILIIGSGVDCCVGGGGFDGGGSGGGSKVLVL